MSDFDRQPADHGLLHTLQTLEMKDPSSNGYTVKVSATDSGLVSNKDETLTLQVLNPAGQPVETFTPDMTKLFHLIVVSRDLSSFAHIHPEYKGHGTFEVHDQFPFAGDFQLISEFAPDKADITVCKQWVTVTGATHDAKPVVPDVALTKTIDGIEVTLSTSPEVQELQAGQTAMLNFHLADAATHRPIPHLEPYLGTLGHGVILDSTSNRYLHVHAMDNMSGGSDVMFHTQFPSAGVYKVWGQFQLARKVITAPFVVQVR
ncbi:MAG: hypothetical protein ACXVDJ_01870 [Tumebacillaceae bacterium]